MIENMRSSSDSLEGETALPCSGLTSSARSLIGRGEIAVAVQMELTRIIINETSDSHIIFLKEVDGERMFPIVIGIFEAIEHRPAGQEPADPAPADPRPPGQRDRPAGGRLAGHLHQRAARAHLFRQAADPARGRARRGRFTAERRDRAGRDRRRADLRRRRHPRRGQSAIDVPGIRRPRCLFAP